MMLFADMKQQSTPSGDPMTTTATTPSIVRAAHIGAEFIDAWVLNAGLPSPGSVTARIDYSLDRGEHESVHLMFYSPSAFDDVNEWAHALEVDATTMVNEDDIEFIDAVCEHRGLVVRLRSNRPVTR